MSLNQETVTRVATLARLKLSPEQSESMEQDLNRILKFIDLLDEVDTSHIEAVTGVNTPFMPMRPDIVDDGNCVEKILTNAPDIACNMFVVPKVVE